MFGRGGSILFFILLFLAFDGPYGAWIVYRLLGTTTVSYVDGYGVPVTMIMGPDAPQPDWLKLPENGLMISGARSGPQPPRLETGSFDFATPDGRAEVTKYFEKLLTSHGFSMTDEGLGPLSPAGARLLGVAGSLIARNDEKGLEARITIRAAEGWIFPDRYVQIVWARTAPGTGPAWPQPPIAPQWKAN